MNNITAVLFDVDGTLLDTREFIFQAFEHTLRTYGLPPVSRAKLALLVGHVLSESYEELTGRTGDDVASLTETHSAFQKEHIGLSAPYPGTLEALRTLQGRGVKMAAVTMRHSRTAVTTLETAGIAPFLKEIVCFDQVERPKPDAMHALKALELINEPPGRAVMVGDTYIDIEAGKNAGTKTIFARYGFHGELPSGVTADAAIDDIQELPGRIR